MERNGRVVKLPNPHGKHSDVGEGLLKTILEQADVSHEEWLGEEIADGRKGETDAEGRTDGSDRHEQNAGDGH